MAAGNGYTYGDICNTIYKAPGGTVDAWQYLHDTLSFVIEIGSNEKRPPESQILQSVDECEESTWVFIEALLPDVDPNMGNDDDGDEDEDEGDDDNGDDDADDGDASDVTSSDDHGAGEDSSESDGGEASSPGGGDSPHAADDGCGCTSPGGPSGWGAMGVVGLLSLVAWGRSAGRRPFKTA